MLDYEPKWSSSVYRCGADKMSGKHPMIVLIPMTITEIIILLPASINNSNL